MMDPSIQVLFEYAIVHHLLFSIERPAVGQSPLAFESDSSPNAIGHKLS
jgi:hypothetical protein